MDSTWEATIELLALKIVKKRSKYRVSEQELEKVKSVFADLRHVEAHTISVHKKILLGPWERLQLCIEQRSQTAWDWWPLQRPRRALQSSYQYVNWNCVRCGPVALRTQANII